MSTRRFLARASFESFGTLGWNSPYPAADSRSGDNFPCSISHWTTAVARAARRLEAERLLLPADVERYVAAARGSAVRKP